MGYLGDLMRDGFVYDDIARLLGLSVHTLYSWTRKGDRRTTMTAATRRLVQVLTILRDDAPDLHAAILAQARRGFIIETYDVDR